MPPFGVWQQGGGPFTAAEGVKGGELNTLNNGRMTLELTQSERSHLINTFE